jgi:uncharacterized glyoxalase superfamily protein PhnB
MSTMIIPGLTYRDAPAALDFLERAFGFERQLVVPGEDARQIAHAELRLGDAWVMLGSSREDRYARPVGAGWVYVVVEEIDPLHERAAGAGAEIVQAPIDTDYGSRDFSALDPEGNLWSFGTYAPGSDG